MSEFTLDLKTIHSQARQSLEQGAYTRANTINREVVLKMLDAALATEWICVLRYSQHAATATGIHAESIAKHFTEHAQEELEHAQSLAKRIHVLGGTPRFDPANLGARAHSQYKECSSLVEMLKENLVAERIAILSYTEMIRHVGTSDPTTRRLLESILEVEEEHADELSSLLDGNRHYSENTH